MGKRDHLPGKLAAVALGKLPDGWHADGGNLYLCVRSTSKSWVFRFTAPDGTRRNMGLGSLGSVSLAVAREHARVLRAKVKDPQSPIDPLEARNQAHAQQRLARSSFAERANIPAASVG